ncbi:MAG: substrate-binding domain-containing protein, partial [Lachnospiraceae bacterium]|nr:substrate-binding domain-containing protein [Lachnospiraceae bacterium]
MKKAIALILALAMALGLAACGSSGSDEPAAPETEAASQTEAAVPETDAPAAEQLAETTIYIDVAKSLEACFEDVIIPAYAEVQPNVTVIANYGGSGGLLSGIEEANGVNHDIFFSAGKAQVTTLNETDGLVVEGSIVELLSNQLCLV